MLEPKKNLGGRSSSIPPNVIEKLEAQLQNPEGFQSYGEIQECLTTCFDIELSYRTVHQLVRYKLKSKQDLRTGTTASEGKCYSPLHIVFSK